ncbi:MAG: hypothetical protein EAX95_00600 [Candidatus Thorarchaeota archaeon]|nr:hypothetical protein [Candidatus Thorarchaeota archaeon]
MKRKKDILSTSLCREIIERISRNLEVYDVASWKEACRSFAPVKYSEYTRKKWFKENGFRLAAAREIVDFIDSWLESLRKEPELETYAVSALRDCLITGIRDVQRKTNEKKGILNGVKLSGFKTLIKWADNRKELEIGPFSGAEEVPENADYQPSFARKKARDRQSPPKVILVKSYEKTELEKLKIVMSITNEGRYPHQNVEIELDIDNRLQLCGVNPFSWSPSTKRIRIGFISASLNLGESEIQIDLCLKICKHASRYTISGTLYFDDLDERRQAALKLASEEVLL